MPPQLKPVQTSGPDLLRSSSIGAPSGPALESLAAFLLTRILANAPRRPLLTLIAKLPESGERPRMRRDA